MEHNDIRHRLSEYIDGSVAGEERAAIEAHLKTCTQCTDALQELRKTIEHIKAVEDIDPPAWMTQKIMATVRAEAGEKKSLFQRLFYPLAVKIPIQAIAVLFLAVTGFYIYQNIQPAERTSDVPSQEFAANKPVPPTDTAQDKLAKADRPAPRSNQVPQTPAYKALDMKQEYEKPAPPVPQEQPPATGPEPAKREFSMLAEDEASQDKLTLPKAKAARSLHTGKAESPELRAAAPRTTAPAMVAEQASGTAAPAGDGFAGVSRAEDKDAEEILSVMEYFVRYDLPKTMKTKGLQYSARRAPEDLAGLQWLRSSTVYRSNTCSRKYLVDVEFSGKSSKYLYCYDYEHDHPHLLGIYELISGTWVEHK